MTAYGTISLHYRGSPRRVVNLAFEDNVLNSSEPYRLKDCIRDALEEDDLGLAEEVLNRLSPEDAQSMYLTFLRYSKDTTNSDYGRAIASDIAYRLCSSSLRERIFEFPKAFKDRNDQ